MRHTCLFQHFLHDAFSGAHIEQNLKHFLPPVLPQSNTVGVSKGPPVAQSHQRQLSLRVDEIQERLIKNKTLLNVIEPSLENPSLEVLLGILQRRIELDKECLFQFNQLKKDRRLLMTSSRNPSVAPAIMRFQKGCQQVGRNQDIHFQ